MAVAVERLILEHFRTRLAARLPGVTVYLGKPIDVQEDPLPALTVVAGEPAEMVNNNAPPELQWTLGYDFQGDMKAAGEDPLPALIDFAHDIAQAVYDPEDRGMGGLCVDHYPEQKQYFAPMPGSTIGSVLVRVMVRYVEEHYDD